MEPITRRELLSQSTVLLLLVPVAACSNSSSPSSGVTPSDDDAASCDGVFEVSTVTQNHTHTLCVLAPDLASPPAAGVTYTTSFNAGHSHTVALTQAQMQTIASGGSVTVTTSSPYPHNFTIQKA